MWDYIVPIDKVAMYKKTTEMTKMKRRENTYKIPRKPKSKDQIEDPMTPKTCRPDDNADRNNKNKLKTNNTLKSRNTQTQSTRQRIQTTTNIPTGAADQEYLQLTTLNRWEQADTTVTQQQLP